MNLDEKEETQSFNKQRLWKNSENKKSDCQLTEASADIEIFQGL